MVHYILFFSDILNSFTVSSGSSLLSSTISNVGDSRSSSSTTNQSLDSVSRSRDKRGKKKRTPTVALPVDRYKERRGISKSPIQDTLQSVPGESLLELLQFLFLNVIFSSRFKEKGDCTRQF